LILIFIFNSQNDTHFNNTRFFKDLTEHGYGLDLKGKTTFTKIKLF